MTPSYESTDVEDILKQLEGIGWQDGSKLVNFSPHSLLDKILLKVIFLGQIVNLNSLFFDKLKSNERDKILNNLWQDILVAGEERFLTYIKNGVEIVHKKQKKLIYLVDWFDLDNNDFFYLHEAKYSGTIEKIKPDITLFVNGIPIVIVEVKKSMDIFSYNKGLKQIEKYEKSCPKLFKYVQVGISWGDEVRYMATNPNWNREDRKNFVYVWKKDEEENILDFLKIDTLVDVLKNYLYFMDTEGGTTKLLGRYIQYNATNTIMTRVDNYLTGISEKKKGLIWHWQGSGKTYTMFFIASKFFDKYFARNPIVFLLVDRKELVDNIFDEVSAIKDFKYKNYIKRVQNIDELSELVKLMKKTETNSNIATKGIYITTIQKFKKDNKDQKKSFKELYKKIGALEKKEIMFLVDEAHRTQYGELAGMYKTLMPNAMRFGFTGTPVMKNEKDTFGEFGYPKDGEFYMDRYFIQHSIQDGFTLPLTYSLIKEGDLDVLMNEKQLQEFVEGYKLKYDLLSEEEFEESNISKRDLKSKISSTRLFLKDKKRIRKVVEMIVDRIVFDTEEWKYKAMLVSVDRESCILYKNLLDEFLIEKFGPEASTWSEVVMTYNSEDSNKNILEYKNKLLKDNNIKDANFLNKENRDSFKKKDIPRIVIVTDMLLTGYNVKRLKVMYLDKPMYAHTLLQAITRTNRPYKDKKFGMIVDSIGIIKHLTETMKFYNEFEENNIKKDFERFLIKNNTEIFEEFQIDLERLKDKLKTLVIDGEELSIDIEEVKKLVKDKDIVTIKKVIKPISSQLAIWSLPSDFESEKTNQSIVLIQSIRKVLKLYKALGAYGGKILYSADMEVLVWLDESIRRVINKGNKKMKLDSHFVGEFSSFLRDNILFEKFVEVDTVVIDDSFIKRLPDSNKGLANIVADYYMELLGELEDDIQDPIYREIYNRVKELKLLWMQKKLTIEEFLKELKKNDKDKEKYDGLVENKTVEERVVDSLNVYINKTFVIKKVKLKLENLSYILNKIINNDIKLISETQKKDIGEKLMLDIFTEVGEYIDGDILLTIEEKIKELVEDFIIKILSNEKK